MTIERRIDPETGRVTLTATGSIEVKDLQGSLREMTEAAEFRPGADIVWDFRKAEAADLTPDRLRDMVSFVSGIQEARGSDYKVAIVVARNVDFGLARMYEAFSDELPCELRVFMNLEDADAWMTE